ncbi:MAG: DNA polymerase III subunit alpha, partial [Actinomycetota bacterium]|nr:DNA polymerase III subunit alpha [Actinomycetota bacterium]
ADIVSQRKQEEAGQFALFGGAAAVGGNPVHPQAPIALDEYRREVLRALEKEVLGLYCSDHPLLGIDGLLKRMTDSTISALSERKPGEVVTLAGIVTDLTKKVTRRGDIMLLMTVEDLSGASVEAIVFAKSYEQFAGALRLDAIVILKGRVDEDAREGSTKLIVLEAHEPDLGEDRPLLINLGADRCTPKLVERLKHVLADHPGNTQVFLNLNNAARTTVLRLGSEFCVDPSNGLHAELKALLGPDALV